MTLPTPSTPTQLRQQQLGVWVAQQLAVSPNAIILSPIASDAGFRCYFRFAEPSRWLAVDAPPQTEDSRQFVALARYLSGHGVNTPTVFAVDENLGFLLVEDFGDQQFYRQVSPGNAENLYGKAINTLIQLQRCPDQPRLIPRYDQALLRRELEIFSEWFVEKLLGYTLNEQETTLLNDLFSMLEDAALAQTQCLVHRDYHSRNLMLHEDKLGVIDFQGALWGAITYDLVSLLRDCYLRWPASQVQAWALQYQQLALKAQLDVPEDEGEFLRDFDWMGLQRHIKVLGIFARLHLRDGKPHYLQDLPLVIRYCLEITQQYEQLKPFYDWFCRCLLPLVIQQDWYKDYHHAGDTP